METLEVTGKTVEEAIQKALTQLGVGREDVEVTVVDKGRAGILGLGAGEARVRVEVRAADVFDTAKETIESFLGALGVAATVSLPTTASLPAARPRPSPAPGDTPDEEAPSPLNFSIEGDDAGLLIGRGGETLGAMQFLVNVIVSHRTRQRVLINLDVGGYRERQAERLRAQALRLAERAAQTGRVVTMEPMPARDRRIVHLALSNHRGVKTESVGLGEERQVTIIPRREGREGGEGREPRFRMPQ